MGYKIIFMSIEPKSLQSGMDGYTALGILRRTNDYSYQTRLGFAEFYGRR